MRNYLIILMTRVVTLLSGCERSGNESNQSNATDFNAADVAWAMDWKIWKFECSSTDIDGMQLVVFNENGDVLIGDSATYAVHHARGQPTVLRVALKINGKSIEGRISASGISSAFNYQMFSLIDHMHISTLRNNGSWGIRVVGSDHTKCFSCSDIR